MSAPARPKPDVNAETYPYEFVQYLLDQTATFTWVARPAEDGCSLAVLTPGNAGDFFGINGGYGLHLTCDLHAFDATTIETASPTAFKVRQGAGPVIGRFRCILLFAQFSDDRLQWNPGEPPPPAIFDRWRSQRFVLSDPEFVFASDRVSGFGVGRTWPAAAGPAPHLLAGGVGNLTGGSGPFAGHAGSFALCGSIGPNLGFEGLITCRIVDPQGDLRTDAAPEIDSGAVRAGDTFIVMRGEKKDRSVRTTFGPDPGPNLQSLLTPSQMRSVYYSTLAGGDAPRAGMSLGPPVATMNADVHFNLEAPPGTAAAPGPFTTYERYEFMGTGRDRPGTITAQVIEGISFGLGFPAAPGQPGVRFTGYGPITGGTGAFAGVEGLLTVNSVIGIAPHALSLTHVLHLVDPSGRFRTGA